MLKKLNKLKFGGIVGSYISAIGASGLTLILGLLTGIIVARTLGPIGRGEIAGLSYISATASGMAMLLISPRYIIWQIHRGNGGSNLNIAKVVIFISSLVAAATSIVIFFSFDTVFSMTTWQILLLITFAAIFQVLYNGISSILRGLKNYNLVSISVILIPLTNVIFLLLVILVSGGNVLNIFLCSTLPVGFFAIYFFVNLYSKHGCKYKDIFLYIKNGYSFFILSIGGFLISSVDRALLMKLSNFQELGYFSVASSITAPILIIAETFIQINYVEVVGSNNLKESIRIALSRFRVGQIVITFIGVAALLFGPFFIKIFFGEKFIDSIPILIWLTLAMVARGQWLLLDGALQALGFKRYSVCISMSGLVVMIFLGGYLTYYYGGNGTALGVLIGYIFMLIMQIFIWVNKINVDINELWGFRTAVLRNILSKLKIKW